MMICNCCDEAINDTTYTLESHTDITGHIFYHDAEIIEMEIRR